MKWFFWKIYKKNKQREKPGWVGVCVCVGGGYLCHFISKISQIWPWEQLTWYQCRIIGHNCHGITFLNIVLLWRWCECCDYCMRPTLQYTAHTQIVMTLWALTHGISDQLNSWNNHRWTRKKDTSTAITLNGRLFLLLVSINLMTLRPLNDMFMSESPVCYSSGNSSFSSINGLLCTLRVYP